MSTPSIEQLKQRITDAGLEIYRADSEVILLAERVRMHLMESGVTLALDAGPRVTFRVRAQRSDFPSLEAEALYERVRNEVTAEAHARGYTESGASPREILHPSDDTHVLDVWFEVEYSKVCEADAVVDELRWALARPRCVS